MKELLKSKKFLATIIGAIMTWISDLTGVSIEAIYVEAGIFGTFIGAQGLADMGKEKAKVEKADEDRVL